MHDGRCTCGRRACTDPTRIGKHPRTLHGFEDATTDEEHIRRWWRMWPDSNVAIATGHGLIVLDVDPRNGAEPEIVLAGAEMPRTPTVRTGGDGLHFYFAGSCPSRKDLSGEWRGIDVKSQDGYVMAPPSAHGSGERYAWLVYDQEPPVLPYYMYPPEDRKERQLEVAAPVHNTRYAIAALRSEYDAARARRDGQGRRNGLFEAGLKLSRFVAAEQLGSEDVLRLLEAAGCESGLHPEEAKSHVANGLKTGIGRG